MFQKNIKINIKMKTLRVVQTCPRLQGWIWNLYDLNLESQKRKKEAKEKEKRKKNFQSHSYSGMFISWENSACK